MVASRWTAEASARLAPSSDRAEYFALLARCYQAASFSFAGQGEADAAWVAADRAMAASESTGEPLAVVASHFRLAHTLIRLQRRQQAAQLAEDTIHALAPSAVDTADHRLLSLYGAMHLVRAVLAGFEHDRSQARSDLAEAERIATIVGDDRNDFDTEFGATNVRLHRVAIAVDLGDAGEAIELAEATNTSHLSHERQMRLLLDLARAYSQRRQLTQAVEALERAEAAAPELFRSHHAAIRVVDQLIPLATGSAKERLNRLARTMRARTV